jgi:hypothetical protein
MLEGSLRGATDADAAGARSQSVDLWVTVDYLTGISPSVTESLKENAHRRAVLRAERCVTAEAEPDADLDDRRGR